MATQSKNANVAAKALRAQDTHPSRRICYNDQCPKKGERIPVCDLGTAVVKGIRGAANRRYFHKSTCS